MEKRILDVVCVAILDIHFTLALHAGLSFQEPWWSQLFQDALEHLSHPFAQSCAGASLSHILLHLQVSAEPNPLSPPN